MFIQVTIEQEDGPDEPTFLNLDEVESIRLQEGKAVIYYKTTDKKGQNDINYLKTPFDKIAEKLRIIGGLK